MIYAPLTPDASGRVTPTAQKYYEQGKGHYDRGSIGQAEQCFDAALRINPNHPGALSDLSSILGDRRQYIGALALAQRAANLAPEHPAFLANLGVALHRNQQHLEAAAMLWKAIGIVRKLKKNGAEIPALGFATLWHNLGLTRLAVARPAEALSCFEAALALAPGEARILRDLGYAKLATGDLGAGLVAHEARWSDLYRYPIWDSGIPRWEGQDLAGKTIVVHHEQGFGDTIQFVRFLPQLRARGAQVILAVSQPMLRLMALSDLADQVVELNGAIPPADYHSPMLSVPAFLGGLTIENIPPAPYLRAPDTLGLPIRKPPGTKLLVGLVWAGAPGYTPDLQRSMPFEALLSLVDLPDLAFVSLQKGERAGDIARAGVGSLVPDLSGLLGDFADTAAALMQIDLVISVDTAVLHLAGALGRPCIALLPYWRCWRWLTERDYTPWYPSMKLVTQADSGDWNGVMNAVRTMILDAELVLEETVEVATPLR